MNSTGFSMFLDEKVKNVTLSSMKCPFGQVVPEEKLIDHLSKSPRDTVLRVNTIKCDAITLKDLLLKELTKQYVKKGLPCPSVSLHPQLNDTLVVKSIHQPQIISPDWPVVIVGLQCGVALLRGAQCYSPGVIAMPNGLTVGLKVSVFADLTGQCKRGWTKDFFGPTAFVGNGLLLKNRKDLFTVDNPKGIAIDMVEPLFDCPSIGEILENDAKLSGFHKGFLQNLPSIVCGHALQVKMTHKVLDMCAAPGGKTTHIAQLMEGMGTVFAIDKSAAKILQINCNAKKLGLENINAFVYDAVKAVKIDEDEDVSIDHESEPKSPPFPSKSFDRILLDAPCSALGQRPQLFNPIQVKELESFPRLQRKLFRTAIKLLKPGGRMIYSTCSYNVEENEEIVRWGLEHFPEIEVVKIDIQVGEPGFQIEGISLQQSLAMQRFGLPMTEKSSDSIGFFLCCFEKKLK